MVDIDSVVDDRDRNALALRPSPRLLDRRMRIDQDASDLLWLEVPLHWEGRRAVAYFPHQLRMTKLDFVHRQEALSQLENGNANTFAFRRRADEERIIRERELALDDKLQLSDAG